MHNPCWGKQPPWWYQLGRTKKLSGLSLSREHYWKEQQTQYNATKRINFHFSTDKPSTQDTIPPKKIRKVTIQHQRRRGKNRQTLAEPNQKTEKAKRKYQPLSCFFRGYESFSISGRYSNLPGPISTDLWHNQTLLQFVFKLAPNFRFSFGPTRDTPALSVFSFPECVWVWNRKNQTQEIQVGEGRNNTKKGKK